MIGKIVSKQTDSSINIMISPLKFVHSILFDRCKSKQVKCSIFNIQIAHLISLTNPVHIAFECHFNILSHIIIDIFKRSIRLSSGSELLFQQLKQNPKNNK